ncbi:type I 3-dehydroquinate dehydratase [Ramlibacter albus]|uniref:3-dehydroquinate dehydratase n=1 Tax=Ramlibacter albus TaxID=2079448 RepID=A0A923S2R8_9BURK|nr:type I 3-dehydroquinate dehydratase [Ramlibacter albus]MBC5765680.1 type I 3-dehydroquinate dehydratase [Ramlibacter albus]
MKPPLAIELAGGPLAKGRLPAICAPLVGGTADALVEETAAVAEKEPDLLEWRVDFFEAIADTDQVLETAWRIRQAAPGIPLLFTRRSRREGGQPIDLAEDAVLELYHAVCKSGLVALVDYEMSNEPDHVSRVRNLTRRCGVKLVLSYHNFQETPPEAQLLARLRQAAQLDADVGKVAVMPRSLEDVLTVMHATLKASREVGIPVITMAMGGWGALTRLCGGVFGSALTFAVGASSSAPGQVPIEDVRAALALIRKAMGES